MAFRKPVDPLTAPWPPGVYWRIVERADGTCFQLRWDAVLPRNWYLFFFVDPAALLGGTPWN